MDSAIFLFLLFGTADTKNLHPQHIVFHAITIIGYSLHFVNKKFFDLSVALAGKLLFLEFLVLLHHGDVDGRAFTSLFVAC